MKAFFSSLILVLFVLSPLQAFADVTKACQVVGSEIDPTEGKTTDNFIKLSDGTTGTTQASEDIFVAPVELIVSDITALVDVAPGANDSWVVYFVADGTRVGGLTCEIAGASAVTCNSGNDEAIIAAGARMTLAIDSGEGTGDPAAAASFEVSACIRRS